VLRRARPAPAGQQISVRRGVLRLFEQGLAKLRNAASLETEMLIVFAVGPRRPSNPDLERWL